MEYIIRESVEDMVNSTESFEKHKKQKEYYDYINNHINNVISVFENYFLPLLNNTNISSIISDEDFKNAINICNDHIREHDASKYGDEEFDGYREKYYPTVIEKSNPDFEEQTSEKVEEAWIHHYMNNPHHPKYWLDKEDSMSLDYIIEMICDSMSFNIDKENPWTACKEWLESNEAWEEKQDLGEDNYKLLIDIIDNVIKLA